ncbi:hypothetical protein GN958_ATG00469 [Phytophthora infestans]|uniref:Uncharacterized protein n=1 Tax=Phytophthora infestans TaxID=4787 RepID=A0A8S9VGJ5_PHYIN|nr:hypothetical protein GN958_ATG00469 [Phytophthora infestans]
MSESTYPALGMASAVRGNIHSARKGNSGNRTVIFMEMTATRFNFLADQGSMSLVAKATGARLPGMKAASGPNGATGSIPGSDELGGAGIKTDPGDPPP